LEKEGNGKIFFEDRDEITTWLVSSTKFLNEHRDVAKKIAQANKELTEWIKGHSAEAESLLVGELQAETKTNVNADTVTRALQRIVLTDEVSPGLIQKAVRDAKDAGFAKGSTDTSKLVVVP
jgi:NitT/TauT family transport system substrate-binding protein